MDYDMDGLEMYDDMGFITAESFKDALVVGGAAAAGMLLAGWAIPKIPLPAAWDPKVKGFVRAGIAAAAGILGGAAAARYIPGAQARNIGMGVMGGMVGMGLASAIGSALGVSATLAALPEEEELSDAESELLGQGDYEDMAALESAVTQADTRNFGQTETTVTREQLFGAGVSGYQPWLS